MKSYNNLMNEHKNYSQHSDAEDYDSFIYKKQEEISSLRDSPFKSHKQSVEYVNPKLNSYILDSDKKENQNKMSKLTPHLITDEHSNSSFEHNSQINKSHGNRNKMRTLLPNGTENISKPKLSPKSYVEQRLKEIYSQIYTESSNSLQPEQRLKVNSIQKYEKDMKKEFLVNRENDCKVDISKYKNDNVRNKENLKRGNKENFIEFERKGSLKDLKKEGPVLSRSKSKPRNPKQNEFDVGAPKNLQVRNNERKIKDKLSHEEIRKYFREMTMKIKSKKIDFEILLQVLEKHCQIDPVLFKTLKQHIQVIG